MQQVPTPAQESYGLMKKSGEMVKKDYLWLNLKDLPYFRAILRAVEARFYQDYPLAGPVLDLGCGDGDFASITFDEPIDAGIDPWTGPVRKAVKLDVYNLVVQGSGDQMPFDTAFFNSAISNSVLEHIPDIDSVLKELSRVMKPGGLFLFCVPNENFLPNLSISSFFDRIGLKGLGDVYRTFFNRISRHHHCDPYAVWSKRLEQSGFRVEKWWNYFSPEALHVLEWGHYFGLPSLVFHGLFRKWILVPKPWNLALTRALVEPIYTGTPEHPKGSYAFYVARRIEK
jgi:SAM-dependent methyltransferase